MASDGRIVIDVILEDGSVARGVGNIDRELQGLDRRGSRLSGISDNFKKMAKVAAGVALGVVGVGAAIGGLAAPLVKAAASAQALNSQFSQVFGDLEKNATASLDKIAAETSILPERLKGSFTMMAAFAKTSGMDTAGALDLTSRATLAAADSAAFYDKSIEEVSESLQSFLKGNFENDAALGISATETTRNAKANELYGKSFKDLGESQKQLALLAMVEDGNKLSGALGQAAREGDGLENVVGNLKQAWENLKVVLGGPLLQPAVDGIKALTALIQNFDPAAFASKFEGIKTVAIEAFRLIKEYVIIAIDTAKEYIQIGLQAIQQFWVDHGAQIISAVKTAFDLVVATITYVLDLVVPFVQEKLAVLQQFWAENGEQIMQAVKKFADVVVGIFNFFLPAILFVVEYIWSAIKNVINGALGIIMGLIKVFAGIFTGDFSKLWEGVKQIFKGAIDLILGLMSLTFVGGIRTAITNLAKTVINLVKTKWTNIVNLFRSGGAGAVNAVQSMVGTVLTFIKNLVTNFTATINGFKTAIVNKFIEIKNLIVNTVKGIDLIQIGKDIVGGLIGGIGNMFGSVKEKISELANLIPDWAKKILGIASPSKVMAAIGVWTGKGLAKGIDSTQKLVVKTMDDLGKAVIAVANANAKEQLENEKKLGADTAKANKDTADKIASIRTTANTKIVAIQAKARKKGKALTTAQKAQIVAIEKKASTDITKIKSDAITKNKKLEEKASKDTLAALSKEQKSYLDAIQAFVDDRRSLDQLSLVEEAAVWEKSLSLFAVGTDERIKVQQNYKKAVEAINAEIVSINTSYQTQMKQISDNLIKQEEELNKAYGDAFNQRYDSLMSFAGTFDEFSISIGKSGTELMANLQAQVDGFKLWQAQFNQLSGRNVDEDLLAELSGLGVKALPELMALNQLTDAQLTQYSAIYKEKATLARQQAEAELVGMKQDTNKQILALREVAHNQLTALQGEWDLKIKALVRDTNTELMTLQQVGVNAGQGLLNGLASMEGPLIEKARQIANAIKTAIEGALDMHSPSRWMRDYVAGNLAKGFDIGVDKHESVFTKAAGNIGNLIKPVINPLRGVRPSLGNFGKPSTINGNTSNTSNNDNSSTANYEINLHNSVDEGRAVEKAMRRVQFLHR